MREIRILFKANKGSIISILTTSIIFFSLLFIVLVGLNINKYQNDSLVTFHEKNMFQFVDDLVDDKETDFLSNDSNYDTLFHLSQILIEADDFLFYIVNDQPFGVKDFRGTELLTSGYEDGEEPIVYNIENEEYTGVKAVQVNQAVFDLNQIQLSEGEFFTADDYVYEDGQKQVPIILGSEYKTDYKLGETLTIEYYTEMFEAKIIGFLEPEQTILNSYASPELILDRYVVLPVPYLNEKPTTLLGRGTTDQLFILYSLFTSINGLVLTDKDDLETRVLFESIAEEVHFSDFQLIGANTVKLDSLLALTQFHSSIFVTVVILAALLGIIAFLIIILVSVTRHLDTFLIFLMVGLTIRRIQKLILIQFLIVSSIGCLITYIIFYHFLDFQFAGYGYVLISILTLLCFSFIVYQWSRYVLKKIDLIQRLKG
ncbi:hypothetical protein CHH78_10475 [Shouchella clausii]|uniref:ABC transporter permease n=1 Tax=Shouchella clausii TaxID=79880 RepID=UPI000BA5975D|nr:ABC transporter permease [Shouchella clausii]PAD43867.1 hypothetical protein CHH54_04660 [Bacillus sp. 7520-S]MBU8597004.1 ABC transporter permease [Shouchella clausii]MCY1104484.1 ABC transporter permease [Shouchella clausii]MED4157214.1 ABC transporter permease [Shouchella clausii]MED4175148.1 ABC transporter permease [Shouchella clausii]